MRRCDCPVSGVDIASPRSSNIRATKGPYLRENRPFHYITCYCNIPLAVELNYVQMALTVSQLCSSLASQSSKILFPERAASRIDLNRKGDTGFSEGEEKWFCP